MKKIFTKGAVLMIIMMAFSGCQNSSTKNDSNNQVTEKLATYLIRPNDVPSDMPNLPDAKFFQYIDSKNGKNIDMSIPGETPMFMYFEPGTQVLVFSIESTSPTEVCSREKQLIIANNWNETNEIWGPGFDDPSTNNRVFRKTNFRLHLTCDGGKKSVLVTLEKSA